MKTVELPLEEVVAIAGTRVLLGAGIALLLGGMLNAHKQRLAGTLLTAVGVVSTVPLAYDVMFRRRRLTSLRNRKYHGAALF